MKSTIQLPAERNIQLRQLADALGGKSMSATLKALFDLARTQNMIPHGIPGVRLNAFGNGIALTFDDTASHGMSHAKARAFTACIRDFVAGTNMSGRVENTEHDFAVSRRGTGIAIHIPADCAPVRVYNADLSEELADLIDRQIK